MTTSMPCSRQTINVLYSFFTVAYVCSHATDAANTAHNWAETNSLPTTGVQCYWLNNWISHWC